jgi:hypothetical protein
MIEHDCKLLNVNEIYEFLSNAQNDVQQNNNTSFISI